MPADGVKVWHVIGPGGHWLTVRAPRPKDAALAAAEARGIAGIYDVRDKDTHNRVAMFEVMFADSGGRQTAAAMRVYAVKG